MVNRNNREKKLADGGRRIPDFELATLRDLHSGEHLILSNRNILYNPFHGSAFLNTEIKHLPHIQPNQIVVTDRCLGKGAFGEVWCGILKNEENAEEHVAIKVTQLNDNKKNSLKLSCSSMCRHSTKAQMKLRSENFYRKLN